MASTQQDVYDATCLVLGEWSDPPSFDGVKIRHDLIPDDLEAGSFLQKLIDCVLDRTPIDMHVAVRERREHRDLAIDEADESSEEPA